MAELTLRKIPIGLSICPLNKHRLAVSGAEYGP